MNLIDSHWRDLSRKLQCIYLRKVKYVRRIERAPAGRAKSPTVEIRGSSSVQEKRGDERTENEGTLGGYLGHLPYAN